MRTAAAPLLPLLAATLVLALPATSGALTFGLASDADFFASFDPAFDKYFGGNVRWGNAGASGDWEYAVVDGSDTPLSTPLHHAWTSGMVDNLHTVLFDYDGATTAALSISVEAAVSSGTATVPGPVNALLVRNRADGGDVADLGSIVVSFDVGGSANLGSLVGDADAEYLVLIDTRLGGGFEVTADANLADGSGSLPQYGFKVGVWEMPEPRAAWLLAGSGLLLALRRRR